MEIRFVAREAMNKRASQFFLKSWSGRWVPVKFNVRFRNMTHLFVQSKQARSGAPLWS
jgi:hypothetical protein